MFICRQCIEDDKVKNTNKELALWIFNREGYYKLGISYGNCESCGLTTECVDL